MDPLKPRLQALKNDLKVLQARAEELAADLEQTTAHPLAGSQLRCVLRDRLKPAVQDLDAIRLPKRKGAPQ
jgi:hypothetical protein